MNSGQLPTGPQYHPMPDQAAMTNAYQPQALQQPGIDQLMMQQNNMAQQNMAQAQNQGETDQSESNKPKNKRRSKNDVDGRDHRCKFCDKTYLSYPALYTHIK